MKLTPLERETPLWARLEKELTANLLTLREKNEGNLSIDETNNIRGEIRRIKIILGWAKDDPRFIDGD